MKTQKPVNHHYVPRVYLKRFADKYGCFFQLCKKYKGISSKHVSQVCYIKDYFKIQREETKLIKGIKDDYHIEINAFTDQENSLSALADEISFIKDRPFKMPETKLKTLLATLITIKRRNPSMRELLTRSMRNEVAADALEEGFRPYMELAWKIDKKDPMIFINEIKRQFANEPSKAEDIYNSSFIDKESKMIQQVTMTFLLSAIQIYHAPPGYEFFTSDNPGFVIGGSDVMSFGGFGSDYLFAFPLSSTSCLVIDSTEKNANIDTDSVYILPWECSAEHVHYINTSTSRIANSKIFVNSRIQGEQFKNIFFEDL